MSAVTVFNTNDELFAKRNFMEGIVSKVFEAVERYSKFNGTPVDKTKVQNGMREMGEVFAKAFLPSARKTFYDKSSLEAKDLEYILRENELPKTFFDEKTGFLEQEPLEKLLHQIYIDFDNTNTLNRVLSTIFKQYAFAKITFKTFSNTNEGDEDLGVNLEETEIQPSYKFPIAFKTAPESIRKILFEKFRNDPSDYSTNNLALANMEDVFGHAKDAPAPDLRADSLRIADTQLPLFTGMFSALEVFYRDKLKKESDLYVRNQHATMKEVFMQVMQKFHDGETAIKETAEFLIFLQKLGVRLQVSIPDEYAGWFAKYKEAHPIDED